MLCEIREVNKCASVSDAYLSAGGYPCPFYDGQLDAMLPERHAATEEAAEMHVYAVQHQLMKDVPAVELFKEDMQSMLWHPMYLWRVLERGFSQICKLDSRHLARISIFVMPLRSDVTTEGSTGVEQFNTFRAKASLSICRVLCRRCKRI